MPYSSPRVPLVTHDREVSLRPQNMVDPFLNPHL